VILQGMKEDPPLGAKCKDKFLVQSMNITPDMVNTSFGGMWSQAEADPTSHKVYSERIKVVFLPPEGETEVPAPHDTTFLSANDSRYDTVRSIPSPTRTNGTTGLPHSFEQPHQEEADRATSPAPDFQVAHDEHPSIEEVITQPPVVVVPVPIPPEKPSAMSPDQLEDLKNKLADAQSEIGRLRDLLIPPTDSATSGFRKRTTNGSQTEFGETESDMSPGQASSIENGVPPQVVAIVALLVFTLTYLFF